MKKLKSLLVILILLVLAGIMIYISIFGKASSSDEEINVEIPLGTGPNAIADILEEKEVIKSALGFKIYIKINNINDFQAGT